MRYSLASLRWRGGGDWKDFLKIRRCEHLGMKKSRYSSRFIKIAKNKAGKHPLKAATDFKTTERSVSYGS